jgi:hypothetical protein
MILLLVGIKTELGAVQEFAILYAGKAVAALARLLLSLSRPGYGFSTGETSESVRAQRGLADR